MTRNLRSRFWLELELSLLSGATLIVTLLWPDWVERISPLDPDDGDGSVEYLLVAGLITLTIATTLLARREWVQARQRVAPSWERSP